jgi:periplasmic protein TonB
VPAPAQVRNRERLVALMGVIFVQLGLGAALLSGFRIDVLRHDELVSRLIEVTIAPPPPRVPPTRLAQAERHPPAAPKELPHRIGGTPGPQPSHPLPAPASIAQLGPSAAPSGGGAGTGPAFGSGQGGASGGEGYDGGDEVGTELVQIAGAILPSDYPPDLRERGLGGRVEIVFAVGTSGRVTSCRVTRSSGLSELDALTCRLIQLRFRYRPSTDRYGRPVADEVEGEHDWVARTR